MIGLQHRNIPAGIRMPMLHQRIEDDLISGASTHGSGWGLDRNAEDNDQFLEASRRSSSKHGSLRQLKTGRKRTISTASESGESMSKNVIGKEKRAMAKMVIGTLGKPIALSNLGKKTNVYTYVETDAASQGMRSEDTPNYIQARVSKAKKAKTGASSSVNPFEVNDDLSDSDDDNMQKMYEKAVRDNTKTKNIRENLYTVDDTDKDKTKTKLVITVDESKRCWGCAHFHKKEAVVGNKAVSNLLLYFKEEIKNQDFGELCINLSKMHEKTIRSKAEEKGLYCTPWTPDMVEKHFRSHISDPELWLQLTLSDLKLIQHEVKNRIFIQLRPNDEQPYLDRGAVECLRNLISDVSRLYKQKPKDMLGYNPGNSINVEARSNLISNKIRLGKFNLPKTK
jgi:hypothetical protein